MKQQLSTKSNILNTGTREPDSRAVDITRGVLRQRAVVLVRTGLIAGFIIFWEIAAQTGWWDVGQFSSPSRIVARLAQWILTGYLWPHLLTTMQEVATGFLLGLVAAVIAGFVLGRNRFLGGVFEPILVTLNAVPRIVLAPLLILWFGIGITSKIALSFLMVFFVVIFAVLSGIREVNQALVNNAMILGASQQQLNRYVYFPAALAWIFSSLRPAIGFAFTAAIVGEFLISTRGIGYLLNAAQNSFDATGMAAALVVLMLIISAINLITGIIERRASLWKWHGD